ncbi:Endoribonuclease Dicer [Dirofilaria immitis]|nr:Endoribonuclease Dicer [Dirofilaria immitis]
MVVRASDVDKDFFTPRDYQVELLDKACKKNIIVPLGTGSGKTFIAVLLIKEYTTKLVIPWKKGGKRAFSWLIKYIFLYNYSVSLVEQQAAHIEHHTTLNVGKMHGHLNQDIWAAVIILDECHHVLGSRHPYRLIMHRYGQLTEVDRPRVLGLTASLINSKIPPSSLEQLLEKLEGIMHSSIETASDLVSEALRTFCLKCAEFHPEFDIDPRKPVLEAVSRTKSVLEQLGPWCAWKVCQLFQRQLKKHSAQGFLPEKQVIFYKWRTQQCVLLNFFNPSNMEKVNPDFAFCGIIFVEQRYVAYVLNTLIRAISRWDSDKFGYLVSDFVIGYNNANIGAEETMALHRRQELVLRKFRQRHLNLLVATSVLEEGVDVRQCNVVIRFDRPTDYRAYVQSKGRARKDDASYFLLVEEYDREQCSCDLKDFLQIERMLLKRYQNVHNPSEPVISPRMETVDDIIAPYIVESTGAQVTLTTAISLVNRYCAKLPSDIFTRLVPQNTIVPETVGDRVMYRAELLLPINSPIKEIIKLKNR